MTPSMHQSAEPPSSGEWFGVLVGGRITDHCLVKATTDTHLLQLGKSLVLGNNTTCCWLAPR